MYGVVSGFGLSCNIMPQRTDVLPISMQLCPKRLTMDFVPVERVRPSRLNFLNGFC